MTITSSGVVCDVCGESIDGDALPFAVNTHGGLQEMHCHEMCFASLEAAADDWHKLPAGPLRLAFEVAHREGEK